MVKSRCNTCGTHGHSQHEANAHESKRCTRRVQTQVQKMGRRSPITLGVTQRAAEAIREGPVTVTAARTQGTVLPNVSLKSSLLEHQNKMAPLLTKGAAYLQTGEPNVSQTLVILAPPPQSFAIQTEARIRIRIRAWYYYSCMLIMFNQLLSLKCHFNSQAKRYEPQVVISIFPNAHLKNYIVLQFLKIFTQQGTKR